MKVQTERSEKETENANRVIIHIGDIRYRISESVDGKLTINKTGGNGDSLQVFPRYANEIDVL